jgi:diacylglycerol kinase family enzyme
MTAITKSPFGELAVIADPRAGGGAVGSRLPDVERAITARGLSYRLRIARSPEEATSLTAAALDEGFRYLAAVGNDLTVHDVVNGMFRDGRPIVEEPVLAVLPAASGCDLVRSFGLPDDVDGAAGHLVGDNIYPFDVMRIATADGRGGGIVRYAHNLAAVGFHAAAAVSPEVAGAPFGRVRRFARFWASYLRSGAQDLAIGVDARERSLRGWSVVVGNGQFAEGGMRLSPRSFPGDGVIDGLVFTGPRSDAYRLLPRMFRHGDHVPDPNIQEFRAKISLRVAAGRPMPVVADGRRIGTTPVSFQVVPRPILLKL